MRAIGFNGGQYGDILMGTVAARAHKEKYPQSELVLGVAEKYSSILSVFRESELFDDTHVWEGYDNWPTAGDELFKAMNRFDKIYQPMPEHTDAFWYLKRHQTEELCLMHGLTPPKNIQVQLHRNWKSFLPQPKPLMGLSFFGTTRSEEKSLSIEKAKEIVDLVVKMGYEPIQFGTENEPKVTDRRVIGSWKDTAINLTACDALITIDTAMAWLASGYSIPTIGLYGYEYYSLAKTAKNWQPVNPNAIYLESPKVDDIIIDRIEAAIKTLQS